MPMIERLKDGLGVIAKRLGLGPEIYPTKEAAETALLKKFFRGKIGHEERVLTLPEEENQDQPLSDT